jgi:pyrimidine operon attenuation protein / uracil phosphoribosyltransferase
LTTESRGVKARQIMSADDVRRALVRIGHEIVERHGGTSGLALVGIRRRGDVLATRLASIIAELHGVEVPTASLDVSAYRDDRGGAIAPDAAGSIRERLPMPFDVPRTTVVLVDDVLYTGRTVRAALDALVDLGRPAAVRLAVLVDRGHREVPIRADYVGRNVPTARDELVSAHLAGVDGEVDEVVIVTASDGES